MKMAPPCLEIRKVAVGPRLGVPTYATASWRGSYGLGVAHHRLGLLWICGATAHLVRPCLPR